MKLKHYVLSIFTVFAFTVAALAQIDPGHNSYPEDCPGDQWFACDGFKYNIGPTYFACSTAKYVYPQDGQVVWKCCEYLAQNVGCEQVVPPDTFGTDLDFIIVRPNKKCKTTSTGQFCDEVRLE